MNRKSDKAVRRKHRHKKMVRSEKGGFGAEKVVAGLVYVVVGTVPILFGAVRPWTWSVYSALIFLAFIFHMWGLKQNSAPGLGTAGWLFVGFFMVWSILQMVPISNEILSVLSPVKFQNTEKAYTLIDQTVSGQALSYAWRVSLAELTLILSLILLYLILVRSFGTQKRFKTLVIVILVLGTLEAFYGIIQALVHSVGVLWVDSTYAYFGMARGTFINRNSFAGFLEMVLPIAIGYTMSAAYWPVRGNFKKIMAYDRQNQSIFLGIVLVAIMLALFFSKSRAGIMGGMAAVLTFFIISRIAVRRKSLFAYGLMGAIGVLFWVYGFVMGFEPVIDRFLQISTDASRLDVWKDCVLIVKDHPLGVGLGNFETVYPVYQVNSNIQGRILDAHNDYVQYLVESGWPGFVLLVSGFFFFLISRIRRLFKMNPDADPFRFFIGVGAISGLVAMGFHGFFDFNFQIPADMVYFVVLMAVVDLACPKPKSLPISAQSTFG